MSARLKYQIFTNQQLQPILLLIPVTEPMKTHVLHLKHVVYLQQAWMPNHIKLFSENTWFSPQTHAFNYLLHIHDIAILGAVSCRCFPWDTQVSLESYTTPNGGCKVVTPSFIITSTFSAAPDLSSSFTPAIYFSCKSLVLFPIARPFQIKLAHASVFTA